MTPRSADTTNGRGAARLEHTTEYRFMTELFAGAGERVFRPILLGKGEYARVFCAEEIVHAVRGDASLVLRRPVAAKVFLDDGPGDVELAFRQEIRLLHALAACSNVVRLHSVVEEMPPTAVCNDCGDVFHFPTCPACGEPLENVIPGVELRCRSGAHVYRRKNADEVQRLLSRRSCGHGGECTLINFLFRPCFFLDLLDITLREFNDLLTGLEVELRGSALPPLAPGGLGPDEWLRERFLMRVACLIQTAEGLASAHERNRVHLDLAPDNVMVSVGELDAGGGRTGTHLMPPTHLIDFGQSRVASDPRTTAHLRGRHLFVAPEVLIVGDHRGKARIEAANKTFAASQRCFLVAREGTDPILAPGDFVRDDSGGEYVVEGPVEPAQSDTVRYEMLINQPPREGVAGALEEALIRVNEAVRVPADIYSFGCLVAWLISGGSQQFVNDLKIAAGSASMHEEIVDETLPERALGDKLPKLRMEVLLPGSEVDDVARTKLFGVIFRCLVRGRGAYAASRSITVDNPARAAAQELRTIYDQLYFLQHGHEYSASLNSVRMDELKVAYDRALVKAETARAEAALATKRWKVRAGWAWSSLVATIAIVSAAIIWLSVHARAMPTSSAEAPTINTVQLPPLPAPTVIPLTDPVAPAGGRPDAGAPPDSRPEVVAPSPNSAPPDGGTGTPPGRDGGPVPTTKRSRTGRPRSTASDRVRGPHEAATSPAPEPLQPGEGDQQAWMARGRLACERGQETAAAAAFKKLSQEDAQRSLGEFCLQHGIVIP